MKDAITMFQEAALQLQKEEAYLSVVGTRELNDKDENLQSLIAEFNVARADLNRELTKTTDKDDEKVSRLNITVNDLYTDIMECESMINYNEAKEEMEKVIAHIQAIIDEALNGGNPMSITEAPEPQGCGGSCSSCSGCG